MTPAGPLWRFPGEYAHPFPGLGDPCPLCGERALVALAPGVVGCTACRSRWVR